MSDLTSGDRLGPYEILDVVGAGGMGVVYRARDTHLQRIVALKVLMPHAARGDVAETVLEEARAASHLNHPGICTVHEVREEAGQSFIVMEYVDGKPLEERIPSDGMPGESAVRYAAQVADALAHAHDRGVLHRDLKTGNIILTREGRTKIVDFGLARRFAQMSVEDATKSNAPVGDAERFTGTLAYMAPEVLQGDPPSVLSDLWAFGVLLYVMVSGRLPFEGRSTFDLTAAILRGPLAPLPAHVPASLRMIVARLLAKEAGERYQSAREVGAALEAVHSSVSAGSVPGADRAPARTRGWRLAVVAAIGVGVLLFVTWVVVRPREARPPAGTGAGRLVQVLSSERQAAEPAISMDGTMVAFVAEDERGQFDLYVSRIAGGGRVRITADEAREAHPRFSPDGERIVFARRRPNAAGPEICLVPALGGEIVAIVQSGSQPAWAADGRRIAFVRIGQPDNRQSVATVRADGTDVRGLVAGDGAYPFVRAPAWSADGRTIVFVRGTGGVAGELWLIPAEGGSPRRLTTDAPSVFSDDPVFTADGRAIVHASNRGGATNIWTLPLDGGVAARLTTGPGPDESPTIDETGRIAFMNARWQNELGVRDLDSGRTRTLVRHASFLWGPAFSPDGREIAYSRSEVDGAWHVWLVDVATPAPRRLSNSDLGEVYPRWSPDGRSVLYHTWGAPRRVWRVPRDGGPPSPITPADLDAAFGDLSPDGRTLVFAVTGGGPERVFAMPAGGGAARPLRPGAGSVPRWSSDGAWIAFAADRSYFGGIFVARADGTEERRLTATGGWPVWWPDSRRIAYLTIRTDGTQQIDTVDLAASSRPGVPLPVGFTGSNYPIDIAADGRSLALTNGIHVASEIWVLEPTTASAGRD